MSLDYGLDNIPDWKNACFEQHTGTDEEMAALVKRHTYMGPDWRYADDTKTSLTRLSATTQTLIFATMSVGIGHITEKNAEEFYTRLAMLERVDGAMRRRGGEPMCFTRDEVRAHIGLRTNVFPEESKATFHAKIARALREKIARELREVAS